MNPFEHYGIATLSPSKINLFAACPGLFVLEHVLKRRTPVGTVAHRGAAVEHGLVLAFDGMKPEDCVAEAERFFDQRAAMSGDARREKHRQSVGPMVLNAIEALLPYGKPSARQIRVSVNLEGVPVPVRGDFDFEWAHHGILTDLKTSDTIPGKIKTSHSWQVALYLKGRSDNLEGRVTYVSKAVKEGSNKHTTYRLENPREHLNAMHKVALTIGKFLGMSNDAQELVAITAPDIDNFMLADPMTRQAVFEVWGY